MMAFTVRDIAWILWLNLAPNARRADGAALVSLCVAYWLLPSLFWFSAPLFLPQFWTADLRFSSVFHSSHGAFVSVLSALIQAIFVLLLLRTRWRKVFL
jgi:hypothetical protein